MVVTEPSCKSNVEALEGRRVALIKNSLVAADSHVTGQIAVSDEGGYKEVFVRWTDDGWGHVQEAVLTPIQCNTFSFTIAAAPGRKVELAVRCTIDNQEYWDNNQGNNFVVCT